MLGSRKAAVVTRTLSAPSPTREKVCAVVPERDIASAVGAWRTAERDFARFGRAGGDAEPWVPITRRDGVVVRCRLSPVMRNAYAQLSRHGQTSARSARVLAAADATLRRADRGTVGAAGRHRRRDLAIRAAEAGTGGRRLHVVSDSTLRAQRPGDLVSDRAEETEIRSELADAIAENADRKQARTAPPTSPTG